MSSKILLYIFTWFSFNSVSHLEQHYYFIKQTVFNALQIFQTDWVDYSTQSSLVIQNSCSIDYPEFFQYGSNCRGRPKIRPFWSCVQQGTSMAIIVICIHSGVLIHASVGCRISVQIKRGWKDSPAYPAFWKSWCHCNQRWHCYTPPWGVCSWWW